MPRMTVVFWNIQNYGRDAPYTKGDDSEQTAAFVAAVLQQTGAGLMMMMEVMPNKEEHLGMILSALNANLMNPDWVYDSIPAAYTDDAQRPVSDLGELTWACGGTRYEGYAVFWNSGVATFRIVPARYAISEGVVQTAGNANAGIPENCLSLVDQGRLLGADPNGGYSIRTGYNPTNPNFDPLRPFDTNGAAVAWSPLDFMSAGKGEPALPRFYRSRRAAYCVVRLVNEPNVNNRQIPVIAYHAPSALARARLGTYLSGLARQLSVTRELDANFDPTNNWVQSNRVIVGGDFNVDATQYGPDYRTYTYQYTNVVWSAGANCQFLAPTATTVQLNQFNPNSGRFNGAAIATNVPTDYYKSPIDNLFYRALGNPATTWVNLVNDVMQNPNNYTAQIQAFDTLLGDAVAAAVGFDATRGNSPIKVAAGPFSQTTYFYPAIQNFNAFRTDVQNGWFSHARRAAEFVHIFVSDHLPIAVAFDVP